MSAASLPLVVPSSHTQPSPCTGSTTSTNWKKRSLIWSPVRSFGLSRRILSTAGQQASRPAMETRRTCCWSPWVSVEVVKFTRTGSSYVSHTVLPVWLIAADIKACKRCLCMCSQISVWKTWPSAFMSFLGQEQSMICLWTIHTERQEVLCMLGCYMNTSVPVSMRY